MRTTYAQAFVVSQAAEATFGTPSYYRIWYGDQRSTDTPTGMLEFGGWLIGCGDGIVYGRSNTLRTDVSIFLTREGSSIGAVTTQPREHGPALESLPDLWSTYAAQHDDLKLTEHWLLELQRTSPYAVSSQAISDAMEQAEKTLERIKLKSETAKDGIVKGGEVPKTIGARQSVN